MESFSIRAVIGVINLPMCPLENTVGPLCRCVSVARALNMRYALCKLCLATAVKLARNLNLGATGAHLVRVGYGMIDSQRGA